MAAPADDRTMISKSLAPGVLPWQTAFVYRAPRVPLLLTSGTVVRRREQVPSETAPSV